MPLIKHILNPQDTVPETTKLDKKSYKVVIFINEPNDLVASQEVLEFSLRKDDFVNTGCDVIAISGGSRTYLQDWFKEIQTEADLSDGIEFISDKKHVFAKDFGVLKVGQNSESDPHALFIIDSNQRICYHNVLSTGIPYSAEECLRLINAVQETESNKVLAPADWKDQGDSVSNDSDSIQNLFSKRKIGEVYPLKEEESVIIGQGKYTREKKEKSAKEVTIIEKGKYTGDTIIDSIIDYIKRFFSFFRKNEKVYIGKEPTTEKREEEPKSLPKTGEYPWEEEEEPITEKGEYTGEEEVEPITKTGEYSWGEEEEPITEKGEYTGEEEEEPITKTGEYS